MLWHGQEVFAMADDKRWELIYNQINGVYISGICQGVRDETDTGGALVSPIEQAYEARNRLAQRLGVDPAFDPDFEFLVQGFEALSRICGRLMYYYGYQDGKSAT